MADCLLQELLLGIFKRVSNKVKRLHCGNGVFCFTGLSYNKRAKFRCVREAVLWTEALLLLQKNILTPRNIYRRLEFLQKGFAGIIWAHYNATSLYLQLPSWRKKSCSICLSDTILFAETKLNSKPIKLKKIIIIIINVTHSLVVYSRKLLDVFIWSTKWS